MYRQLLFRLCLAPYTVNPRCFRQLLFLNVVYNICTLLNFIWVFFPSTDKPSHEADDCFRYCFSSLNTFGKIACPFINVVCKAQGCDLSSANADGTASSSNESDMIWSKKVLKEEDDRRQPCPTPPVFLNQWPLFSLMQTTLVPWHTNAEYFGPNSYNFCTSRDCLQCCTP